MPDRRPGPLQHGRGATEGLELRRMAEPAQESAPRSLLLPKGSGSGDRCTTRSGSNENRISLVDFSVKVALPRGNSTCRVDRPKLCPRLCPNECLPSTNTVTYGRIPRETLRRQIVEANAKSVSRCASGLLQNTAFQACLIDRSSISPSLESTSCRR
jgi:hypothetical protein